VLVSSAFRLRHFRFQPVAIVAANATNFEQATLDRFENKFVNILRFQDYAFKRVN
jgi:hypothetical protein